MKAYDIIGWICLFAYWQIDNPTLGLLFSLVGLMFFMLSLIKYYSKK